MSKAQIIKVINMTRQNIAGDAHKSRPRDPVVATARNRMIFPVHLMSIPILPCLVINIILCCAVYLSMTQKVEAQSVANFNNRRNFLWNNYVVPCLGGGGPGCKAKKAAPGYFVFAQNDGQYLLIPSILVSGIEANIQERPIPTPPKLPSYTLPNYLHEAFQWAEYFHGTKQPYELVVAINSANARSEDQLHVHICTLLPAVQSALKGAMVGTSWHGTPYLKLGARNRLYDARHIKDLSSSNPFLLLFEDPGAGARTHQMADQAVLVTGAPQGGGYYILNGHEGSVEELLNGGPVNPTNKCN